jgi:hypothetical protein
VPNNVLQTGPQVFAVLAGLIVLLGGAFAFSFKHRATSSKAGESGHRPADAEEDVDRVSPDGFIDSFAGVISEAGGGMPVAGWAIIGVVSVCYVAYLILFWNPGR